MTLLDLHRKKLVACGLRPETWQPARLHSGSADEVREILGYGGAGTGLIIPYDENYSRVRIDNPGPDGKRYRSPRATPSRIYVPPTLAAELCVYQDDSRAGLNGAGVLIVNPPWQTDEALREALTELHALLAQDPHSRQGIQWLVPER